MILKYLYIFLFFVISFSASSQVSPGTITIGGAFAYDQDEKVYFNKVGRIYEEEIGKYFNADPQISIFFTEYLSIGLKFPLSFEKITYNLTYNADRQIFKYSIGPILRYHLNIKDYIIFVQGNINIGKVEDNNFKQEIRSYSGGIGVTYIISNLVGLEVIGLLNKEKIRHIDNSFISKSQKNGIALNFGFLFYLNRK